MEPGDSQRTGRAWIPMSVVGMGGGGRLSMLPGPDAKEFTEGTLSLRPRTGEQGGIYLCKPVAESHICSSLAASPRQLTDVWLLLSPPSLRGDSASARFQTLFSLHKEERRVFFPEF